MTLSGNVGVRAKNTGTVVHETVTVGTDTVHVDFDNAADELGISGTNVTLGVGGVFTLSGSFAFTKQETTDNGVTSTKIKVGATGVNAFLGTSDKSMGIKVADSELGLGLFKSGP